MDVGKGREQERKLCPTYQNLKPSREHYWTTRDCREYEP